MYRHGKYLVRVPDCVFAPLGSGLVVLFVGLLSLLAGHPWLFASLGPTGFQLTEYPEQRSSRSYNVIVGHLSALGLGFASVAILNAWGAPNVLAVHYLTPLRVWASVLAMTMTSAVLVLLRASHPPAGATALLVALGSFSTWNDARAVIAGVLAVGVLGEVLRFIRLHRMEQVTAEKAGVPTSSARIISHPRRAGGG